MATPDDQHYNHMLQATINSVLMVIGTELGDKTFFIAAVLGMRSPGLQVFLGAWGALAAMSVLSVIMGMVLPEVISFLERMYGSNSNNSSSSESDTPLHHIISHYLSLSLFAYFGVKALLDAKEMYEKGEGAGVSDELAEVEEELEDIKSPSKGDKATPVKPGKTSDKNSTLPEGLTHRGANDSPNTAEALASPNSTAPSTPTKSAQKAHLSSPPVSGAKSDNSVESTTSSTTNTSALAFIATVFGMTFTAEWGDKSQVATIAMGASRDCYGVVIGAVFGHALCTGLAVLGGKLLATSISERVTVLGSGFLFLGFAVHGYLQGPEE